MIFILQNISMLFFFRFLYLFVLKSILLDTFNADMCAKSIIFYTFAAKMTNMKQITIKVAWNNSAFEGSVSSETSYGEIKIVTKDLAQVRKSVDSPPGMLTEDHHHTVHEERQVCYSSHLRPKSLHL